MARSAVVMSPLSILAVFGDIQAGTTLQRCSTVNAYHVEKPLDGCDVTR